MIWKILFIIQFIIILYLAVKLNKLVKMSERQQSEMNEMMVFLKRISKEMKKNG